MTRIVFSYNCIQNGVHILLLEMWNYESIKTKIVCCGFVFLMPSKQPYATGGMSNIWPLQLDLTVLYPAHTYQSAIVHSELYRLVGSQKLWNICPNRNTVSMWGETGRLQKVVTTNIKVLFQNLHDKTAGERSCWPVSGFIIMTQMCCHCANPLSNWFKILAQRQNCLL